ncbi:hypothetical protein AAMO2058_000308900 [Amorphochlora amoebiformis]
MITQGLLARQGAGGCGNRGSEKFKRLGKECLFRRFKIQGAASHISKDSKIRRGRSLGTGVGREERGLQGEARNGVRRSAEGKQSSKIVELVSAGKFLFSLSADGTCIAYQRACLQKGIVLNLSDMEIIRSVFHNKLESSVIIVYTLNQDPNARLYISTILLSNIESGHVHRRRKVLRREQLYWPSFIEFDNINRKILVFSATERLYKVWELSGYRLHFVLQSDDIDEIKISKGILLVINERSKSHVKLRIVNIHTGSLLVCHKLLLHRHSKIEFIDILNDKIIIKQDNQHMQILDLGTKQMIKSSFVTPLSFLFLHQTKLFLAFREDSIETRDFNANMVARIKTGLKREVEVGSNCVVNANQTVLITNYKDHHDDGWIDISDIRSGKNIAKLQYGMYTHVRGASITAMCFSDSNHELYTGSRDGTVLLWSAFG